MGGCLGGGPPPSKEETTTNTSPQQNTQIAQQITVKSETTASANVTNRGSVAASTGTGMTTQEITANITVQDSQEKKQEEAQLRTPINIHNYRIGRTLGSGASCKVVVGSQKSNEKNQVAIKIMNKDRPIMHQLYHREVDILSRLCPASVSPENYHKNILRFEGCCEDENCYYIVTKMLEGGELFDRIVSKEEKYIITEKQAAFLIRDMLTAVKYCHDHNIVHRDLKPENFVMATKEVNADVVLIDYGCASVVKDDDIVDDIVGTAYYLAPELACAALHDIYKNSQLGYNSQIPKPKKRNGRILKATDVWAMGVISYVMMTGRAPFRGKDNQAIFEATCLQELKFPEKDARYQNQLQLSDHFKDFVSKILVKNPDERISIDDAIRHPWVQGIQAGDYRLNRQALDCLRQFNYQSKLKKEITRVLASHSEQKNEEEILRHFKRLDADGDNYLVVEELELLLKDMGYANHELHEEAVKMVQNADVNGDQRIDLEEFKTIWFRKVLSTNDQYIRGVFNVFDDNGDGHIDARELQLVLFPSTENKPESSPNPQSAEPENFEILESIRHMIEEVDENGDQVIQFEEFQKAMKEDIDNGRLNMTTLLAGGKIQ